MKAYEEDRKFADVYNDRLQMIAMKALRVSRVAPVADDVRRATDFQFMWRADEPNRTLDIAGRVRRPSYDQRYPHDITFRYERRSGAATEWRKIVEEGCADFAVYAIALDDGRTDLVKRAVVLNLGLLRNHVGHRGEGRKGVHRNAGGESSLVVWDLQQLAFCPQCLGMILYSEGHGAALDARYAGCSTYDDMVERTIQDRTGCARFLDRERRWCNRTDGLKSYQVGPLCPEHQPS